MACFRHHACADLATNPADALPLVFHRPLPPCHLSLSFAGTPRVSFRWHLRADTLGNPLSANPVYRLLVETRPIIYGPMLPLSVRPPLPRLRESSFSAVFDQCNRILHAFVSLARAQGYPVLGGTYMATGSLV